MPRVLSYLFLIFFSLSLSACETTQEWLKGFEGDDKASAQEQTIDPLPMNGTYSSYSGQAAGGSLEKLRRASMNYYGGMSGQMPQTIEMQGTASALDPNVEIYPIDGAYAPGTVLQPDTFQHAPMSYEYQSMFPELGGVEPARRSSAAFAGSGGKALAPILGSGDNPSRIFFKHGSSYLGSGDKRVLEQVAEQAKFSPVMHINVDAYASKRTGISDPIKSAAVNLKQSMYRAQAVSEELINNGVPLEKIKTSTWGDTKLSGHGEEYDRRVDIVTGGQ